MYVLILSIRIGNVTYAVCMLYNIHGVWDEKKFTNTIISIVVCGEYAQPAMYIYIGTFKFRFVFAVTIYIYYST